MLCDICHKNIATVHLTEIVNEKVEEMHICQKCAKDKTEEIKEQLNISDFLGGLAEIGGAKSEKSALKCSSCGLTYDDFRKKGKLGCQECYATFRDNLLPLLKKIHGSIQHNGKAPFILKREAGEIHLDKKVKELRNRLEDAIKKEEYEEAARLRDQLKKIDKGKNNAG